VFVQELVQRECVAENGREGAGKEVSEEDKATAESYKQQGACGQLPFLYILIFLYINFLIFYFK